MKILIEIMRELICYIQAFNYTLLGIVFKVPDSIEGEKSPVILIPGLGGNPFVLRKLRNALIARDYPVFCPDLSYQVSSFENNARKLEQFILQRNLKDVYIIGHSAGGIIVTQMGYKGRDRIKKFFAVSTPFHGTWLALFIFFFPAGRQLIPGSAFLKNNEINFMTFPNLQCLFSRFDLMIIPGFQGRLGRIDDTEFPGLGHLNIIMSNDGVKFIANRLEFEDSKEEPKNQKKKDVAKPENINIAKTKKTETVKEVKKPLSKTLSPKTTKLKSSAKKTVVAKKAKTVKKTTKKTTPVKRSKK